MNKFQSKAFVYYKPYDVRLEEIEIECGSIDIIIRVLASARCGTDKTIYYKGYAVGACFGGTHDKVERADLDTLHYRSAKTIGTSGCSTKTMETVIEWLKEGKIRLRDFPSKKKWTFESEPKEFFTAGIDGLKPILYPWK